MLTIDGSVGEGGGQILRSSLALSAICKNPVTLINIRGKRPKPGLQAQHLCAVRAAARVSNAFVEGDALHSQQLTFHPQDIIGGYHEFDIGTAGSCSLVLQTILPMFLHARCEAEVKIFGGTHNPWCPSIDFLQHSFLPLLNKMGARISLDMPEAGFYPRGGGCIHVHIDTRYFDKRLDLLERGERCSMFSLITTAKVPEHVIEREQGVLHSRLGLKDKHQFIQRFDEGHSEGNFVSVVVRSELITECFGEPAKRRVPAERIANNVANQAKKYLKQKAPVGEYLADQLLLPMLLGQGGSFVASTASLHSTTNIDTIHLFCGDQITLSEHQDGHLFHIKAIS